MPNIPVTVLVSRDLTATDGAQVNSAPAQLQFNPDKLVLYYAVTTTGTPTTYDMRVAIEGSFDGATWFQLVRMADLTNAVTAPRFCRLPGTTAAAEATTAVSTLNSAAASATISHDAPWPRLVRGVSKLQTLTGGTAPHIISSFYIEGSAA